MKRIFTVFMAILLVSAMLMSFASCGSDDKAEDAEVFTTDEAVYTESATPVGKTSAEVLDYFNSLVNGVKTSKPAISYYFEKNVPDDSLKVTKKGAEDAEEIDESLKAINDSAKGIKDMILANIKENSGEIAYGADNSEILFVKGESFTSALTVADIDYATIKEVGDNYYITIAFNDIEKNGDTAALAKAFDIPMITVDLTETRSVLTESIGVELSPAGLSNIAPRLRMTTLYAIGQTRNALVVGTGNRSERYMGYFTKFGDGGFDLNPIADLTATEVFEFLRYLEAPLNIITKAPSAGLFEGQTDEQEMGVSYAAIDRYLLTGEANEQDKAIIDRYHSRSAHKLVPAVIYEG